MESPKVEIPVYCRLDEETFEKLERVAFASQRKRSDVIRILLTTALCLMTESECLDVTSIARSLASSCTEHESERT
jgi:hypothetical protein